jgi:hypothetical protein
MDEENDFGFTFSNAEEEIVTATSTLEEQVIDLKKRLQTLRKIYLPLLEDLSKQPEKPFIKWPNRKEVLDKHIAKMKELTEVS